jgi:hypothetical protein
LFSTQSFVIKTLEDYSTYSLTAQIKLQNKACDMSSIILLSVPYSRSMNRCMETEYCDEVMASFPQSRQGTSCFINLSSLAVSLRTTRLNIKKFYMMFALR